MKIPNYIKTAIIKAGKYIELASQNSKIVTDWLEQNAPKDLLWEDYLIDCIQVCKDGSKELIQFLESDGEYY